MGYRVTHLTGEMEVQFPISRFGELYDELGGADVEHPDVSVAHGSEWSLSVYGSGFVVLEDLEEGEPVHLGPMDRSSAIELMVAVAEGRFDEVRSKPWLDGYPPRR